MAAPHNVEVEAAKFLHKLIQDSTDEPTKLATKLYVILQHMRSSGKEYSMPYEVISRAMETVINQHNLDIEALIASRLPLTGGPHMGGLSTQFSGSSQIAAIAKNSKFGMAENEAANSHGSSRPPVGQSGAGHDIYQGSVSHLSTKSFDHESPSSFETRSANSQSQERHEIANWEKANQNDSKKSSNKRKRADLSSASEPHIDNPQQLDACNLNARKGKLVNKVEPPAGLSFKGSENSQLNMVQASGQMEHIPSLLSSIRTTNITNLMSQTANSKYPEELEVSAVHGGLGQQEGGSRLLTHDVLSSRRLWNQNKLGFSLEKSQASRFPSNAGSGNSTAEILMNQSTAPLGSSASGKVHGAAPGASGSYPVFGESQFLSANQGELGSSTSSSRKPLEHDVGTLDVFENAHKMVQNGIPSNIMEMNMHRGAPPRDTGKYANSQAPGVSNTPFKEQQLKQLRAQCLVFLALRNGLMPRRLHLEIALGNFLPKEDGPHKEIDHKGKELSINDPRNFPEDTMLIGRLNNVRETEIVTQGPSSTGIFIGANSSMGDKNHLPSDLSIHAEERRHLLATRKNREAGVLAQELAEPQSSLTKGSQPDSLSVRGSALENGEQAEIANQVPSVTGISKQMKPEMINRTGIGSHIEVAKGLVTGSMPPHESVVERKARSQSQILSDCKIQGSRRADRHLPSFPSKEHWKPISGMEAKHLTVIPAKDGNGSSKNVSEDDLKISEIQRRRIPDGHKTVLVDDMQSNGSPTVLEINPEEEDTSFCTDLPPSPKYTTSEKWIMEQKERKLLIERNWTLKWQKTEQRIASCVDKSKEIVSSSEDISAKTKTVIELKKLQLLKIQRRLRSHVLNDFFKPIATEMDRLKSIKKHKVGRRPKQIERFEQKMKEERQKRIRERQKEFFGEIEVHKERLDDAFKMKRERWKGFNKYVKEFHKRKERVHREKIDRIQREKINLLKINDVEGYLRMVQDAKSDRVKQLLKETEKYLQKLGSRLQEAKSMPSQFETDIAENRASCDFENSEIVVDNEDEADQAKHYMESNEKYYLMAHSIKESIAEQPTCLVGGKLREYQMNGLRWLVSLYNNHLNGILADEMGLGKTVQVIALICYLMETKNDRGPFLVVVPSSVLPGWELEFNFWAPGVSKIVYSGPPEERRRLFKERIVNQKFNVLLTTYEYLMNKHDRPKLSKIHWHYVIIDEGHRIKNASCKLNAELKHYRSSHRLLLTGTPLQNNLDELWALLNFLLPNIFNSSEDFSQWFNKPFESNCDNSPDEVLLSEEENLLIINRLHQVLRPFVLRRLKHKVENELPEKIERLVRCEASAYQKLLMKRVEDNLGAIGTSKGRSVHNTVMELRNICNHPYLSHIHVEEIHDFVPQHYLPNIVRLCGKLEMLDRLLPKLKATGHRVLFFSTMTRLLDVMEDYLYWKQYRYTRLDGHTSGGERGALIEQFNRPGSPFFIFLLSIRAGGVGVNLQAADTVIIFDTDWNPQVDLQAQARAHRLGQKKDVLVLRLETVQTVEEQVRAAAEHKLGVANQSITAGFFDNNTSAEDRREYLESLLRECKKEEAAPVLDDDALNDLIARSESEIDVFESVDRQRREEEMLMWKNLVLGQQKDGSQPIPPPPSRLLIDDDLKAFYEAMKISEESSAGMSANVMEKRKSGLGGLDIQHYGRGKRAREVRSYEEQWTEDEFEKMCQVDHAESPQLKEEVAEMNSPMVASGPITVAAKAEPPALPTMSLQPSIETPMKHSKEVAPSKRGRGRPKKRTAEISPCHVVIPASSGARKPDKVPQTVSSFPGPPGYNSSLPSSAIVKAVTGTVHQFGVWIASSSESTPPTPSVSPCTESASTPSPSPSVAMQVKEQVRKTRSGAEAPQRRGKKQVLLPPPVPVPLAPYDTLKTDMILPRETVSSFPTASCPNSVSGSATAKDESNEQGPVSPAVPVLLVSSETGKMDLGSEGRPVSSSVTGISGTAYHVGVGIAPSFQPNPPFTSDALASESISPSLSVPKQPKGRGRKPQSRVEAPRHQGKKQCPVSPVATDNLCGQDPKPNEKPESEACLSSGRNSIVTRRKGESEAANLTNIVQVQASEVQSSDGLAALDAKPTDQSDYLAQNKQHKGLSTTSECASMSLDETDSQTEKIEARALEMRVPVIEQAIASESEVRETKSLEKNNFSMLETAASVTDPEIKETLKDVAAEAEGRDYPDLQQAVVSKSEVFELETKLGADPFEDVEDSRDLHEENSVMKTNVGGTSAVPLNAEPLDDATCEEPLAADDPVSKMAALVLEPTMDKNEDRSGKEKDSEEQEMKHPVPDDKVILEPGQTNTIEEKKLSTLSLLEASAPVADHSEVKKTEKEVDLEAYESNDPILQEAVVSNLNVCETETESFEKVSTFSTLVTSARVADSGTEMTANEVGAEAPQRNDPILEGAVVSKPEVCETETKINSSSCETEN